MSNLSFFNSKNTQDILIYLRTHEITDCYAGRMSKEIDVTYSHVIRILRKLQNIGIINLSEKQSRIRYATLKNKLIEKYADIVIRFRDETERLMEELK